MTITIGTAARRIAELWSASSVRLNRASDAVKARLSAACERALDDYDHVCDTCFGDLSEPLHMALFAIAVGMAGGIVCLGIMAVTRTGVFA